MILQDLGQPAAARTHAERALTIREAAYGPDHPAVARATKNLAAIRRETGETS